MKIKCPKCKHKWETKSTLSKVTCPSCQLKIPNPNYESEEIRKTYLKGKKNYEYK